MTFSPSAPMVVDAEDGKFVIRCPVWANDLVRDLPSRRFSKAQRAWTAPILKQNVEAVKKMVAMPGVRTTDAAVLAIAAFETKLAGLRSKDGFPSWYKFKREPRKHQMLALNRGYGAKAFALFMDMQTGKSKTSIDMTVAHRMEGHITGVLILTKLSLRQNWKGHFEKDCPIPYSMHLPFTDREREFDAWLAKPHDFKVMVVGWESLSAGKMIEFCRRFMAYKGRAIIGDETTFITGHKAQRSEFAVELAHMAEYRYALTGTPALEGPMNLYMQFEFLDPDIIGIGDFYAFRNQYAMMGGYMRPVGNAGKKIPTKIIGYQNLDELMNLIAPHAFQITKAEAYDLPPKRYQVRTVEITPKQREMYRKVKSEGVLQLKGGEEHVLQNILEVALRLHQVTGGYGVMPREERYWGRDPKTKEPIEKVRMKYDPYRLMDPTDNPKIRELNDVIVEAKHKQGIIWAVYRHEIEDIVALMRKSGLKVGELHGGVPERERQPQVDAFERGDVQWIVGNASTGGMGYTMMASEVNIFYNNTFKAIDRVQGEDRAYGDGQTKSGIWIDIVAEKTVDVLIMKALEAKQDLAEFVRYRINEAINLLDGEVK